MQTMAWRTSALLVMVIAVGSLTAAHAAKVGHELPSPPVRDVDDKPSKIPDFGKKVLAVFYTDPDVKDQNEPFRDKLKAASPDMTRYRGLGIVNLDDTWMPNFAIRKVIRNKIRKFNAVILTDPDHLVQKAWKLGECNGKDVVLIIGADKRLKYIKADGAMSVAEQKRALALVRRLIAQTRPEKLAPLRLSRPAPGRPASQPTGTSKP